MIFFSFFLLHLPPSVPVPSSLFLTDRRAPPCNTRIIFWPTTRSRHRTGSQYDPRRVHRTASFFLTGVQFRSRSFLGIGIRRRGPFLPALCTSEYEGIGNWDLLLESLFAKLVAGPDRFVPSYLQTLAGVHLRRCPGLSKNDDQSARV